MRFGSLEGGQEIADEPKVRRGQVANRRKFRVRERQGIPCGAPNLWCPPKPGRSIAAPILYILLSANVFASVTIIAQYFLFVCSRLGSL